MKRLVALLTVYAVLLTPLYAPAAAVRANAAAPTAAAAPSLLEAAEAAAASGVWRAQNTPTISTGLIRDDDRKRSALAFALSGLLAFGGAGLWRWLPCRGKKEGSVVGGVSLAGYNKCYDKDGNRRGLDTPTKALLAAGVTLELVSLGYLIAHLAQDSDDDRQGTPASNSGQSSRQTSRQDTR